MPHVYPPEDPRSAASTFAPFMPGAGVVADDVPEEQNPGGGTPAAEANEEYADKPLPDTGPGPDRANYVHPRHLEGEELRVAAGLGDVPAGEGRQGKATRERDAKRAEEADKANEGAVPVSEATDTKDSDSKSTSSTSSSSATRKTSSSSK